LNGTSISLGINQLKRESVYLICYQTICKERDKDGFRPFLRRPYCYSCIRKIDINYMIILHQKTPPILVYVIGSTRYFIGLIVWTM